ncbi:MAG: response regulator [Myxococcota bacterium]
MIAPPLLLVEDDPDDVLLFRTALRMCGEAPPLHVVGDGEAALEWLGTRTGADLPLPALVVLDLKLPRLSGLAFLEELRASPVTRGLAVAVLSSSEETQDVQGANQLGVIAYHVKPVGIDGLVEVVRALCAQWRAFYSPSA